MQTRITMHNVETDTISDRLMKCNAMQRNTLFLTINVITQTDIYLYIHLCAVYTIQIYSCTGYIFIETMTAVSVSHGVPPNFLLMETVASSFLADQFGCQDAFLAHIKTKI